MAPKQHPELHHTGPAGITPAGPDVLCQLREGAPSIMGIINATPDSFSDGGTLPSVDAAVRRAIEHVEAGARILDIGGESTRPGAQAVPSEEQKRRVLPVIEAIQTAGLAATLSIDTCDADVAEAAIQRGVGMINDVTGLGSPAMATLVARSGVQVVLMHMRGTPQTMQDSPHCLYDDVVAAVVHELEQSVLRAQQHGIKPSQIWVDPGLGFAKTPAHCWQLTRQLDAFTKLGYPIVFGASRKGFLSSAVPRPAAERDAATAAVCTAAVMAGAQVVRVHNVAAVRDAVAVGYALRQAG